MAIIICRICGKQGQALHTIRAAWGQAGGWGEIPDSAIVHPNCDRLEQAALKSGRLKLTALYQPVQRT